MSKVLKADGSAGNCFARWNASSLAAPYRVVFDAYIPSSTFTALAAISETGRLMELESLGGAGVDGIAVLGVDGGGSEVNFNVAVDKQILAAESFGFGFAVSPAGSLPADTWLTDIEFAYDGSDNVTIKVAGTTLYTYNEVTAAGNPLTPLDVVDVGAPIANGVAGEIYYIANVRVYDSTDTLVFSEDFSSGDLSHWSTTVGDVSVVDYPFPPPPPPWYPGRRVGVAFDDGPLEPNPTWTWLDDDSVFPPQFVAGYDTKNGRQTLISQTETGTATVYINDRAGLFDDRNSDSPYQGKLSGRQIILQLWNPVTEVWEPQFRGHIDDYSYDIDGSAVDANGDPINASIQLECVDMFDFLNGYGLTPGLDGVTPPTGMEDGIWYAQTTGGVYDRIVEILTDATSSGWVAAMSIIASGNVNVIGVKYDPDESALTALRDAADAEMPFIANIYINRHGQFCFRGRYSRFVPDTIAAEPGSDWDFARWPLGDGKAIQADSLRGQIREISYTRSRGDLINAAIAYPQGIAASDMPGQVYASSTSIANFGKHQASPMSDLLTCEPTVSGYDKKTETAKFAELLVRNKKAPRIALTRLQLKAMRPDDPRAAATWGAICGADISHIVNVAVGYPGGTGLQGASPTDDYYVEGRSLTVRPLNPTHDYVECDLDTSPAVWSMDTNGVFPGFS